MGGHYKEEVAGGPPPALETLRAAHRVGQARMASLEKAALDLEAGRLAQGSKALEEALAFFRGDLERHFYQEEQALFPALAREVGWGGPLRAMMEEHHSLWRAVDALEEALPALGGPGNGGRQAAQVARHIAWLLRSHIDKENSMLFPLAERALAPAALEEVARAMAIPAR